MADSIVTEEVLKERWKIGNQPTLIRYLVQLNIPFRKTPKNKIWTTQAAIDKVLMPQETERDSWDFPDAS